MAEPLTLISGDETTVAQFVTEANMLCSSLVYRGTELLDQGRGVQDYAELGKTMGIPLLHPWANRLADWHYEVAGKRVTLPRDDRRIPQDPNGLPIHGVLPKLLRWELGDRDQQSATAMLAWTDPRLLELFPFEHQLSVTVTVSPGRLRIATTLAATGDDAVPVSFGYHPYLRLPEPPREDWDVQLGAATRLALDGRMLPTGAREPVERRSFVLGERSLDDAYAELDDPASFQVEARGAGITAEFHRGYRYAQVYAPAGQQFICFEPMTAPANALHSGQGLILVAAGSEYVTEFSVAFRER